MLADTQSPTACKA